MSTVEQALRLYTDDIKFCTLGKPDDFCTVAIWLGCFRGSGCGSSIFSVRVLYGQETVVTKWSLFLL